MVVRGGGARYHMMAGSGVGLLLVLCAGLARDIALAKDYTCGPLNSNVTLPFNLKPEPSYLQWSFRKSPRSLPSIICTWSLPDHRECRDSYKDRAQIYMNGTLVLHLIRSTDSGWYNFYARYRQGRSIHYKVQLYVFGLSQGITLSTDYTCGWLNSNVTLSIDLKQQPTFLQWIFRKTPKSMPSIICTWQPPDRRECQGNYKDRVQIYVNGTLVLGYIRSADSGWYYFYVKFSRSRSIYRNMQLYVFASSSRMIRSPLPLLLGLMLLKCSL